MTATVRASSDSVVEWFRRPGQREAVLAQWEREGKTECSIEDTVTGSTWTRDIRWTVRTGATMHQHIESPIGADGRPGTWNGEHFVIVGHEVNHVCFPTGREETVDCANTLEFVPVGEGETQIISTHRHLTVGAHWYQRLLPPNRARAQMASEWQEMAARCEHDLLGASSD